MVLAVVEDDPEVDHRIAREEALPADLLDALLDGRDEVARDRAAVDVVHELEVLPAGQRLDLDPAVGELAVAAGLLLVAAVRLGLARDRLAVGDLRADGGSPRRRSASSAARRRSRRGAARRRRGGTPWSPRRAGSSARGPPRSACGARSRSCPRPPWPWARWRRRSRPPGTESLGRTTGWSLVVSVSPVVRLLELRDGDDVAGPRLGDVDVLLALGKEEARETLVHALGRVPVVAVGLEVARPGRAGRRCGRRRDRRPS